MRYVCSFIAVFFMVCVATGAQGADKQTTKEVNQLAAEVQNKIVSRTDAEVKVQARGCWLHIEFAANNATFDLPLVGTVMAETDMEDGIVLQNTHMVRTISNRAPESYERLILKFGRYNSKPVIESFENAIKACGGGPAASTATARRS